MEPTADGLAEVTSESLSSTPVLDEAVAGLTLPERFKGYDMGPAKRAAEAIYSETK